MLELLFALLCIFITGYLVLLLKSYSSLSVSELKRQARTGNQDAKAVYAVRGVHGDHVYVLLWASIGIFLSLAVVLMRSTLWSVVVVISSALLAVVLAMLPRFRYSSDGLTLARLSAPVVVRVLSFLRPVTKLVDRVLRPWFSGDETIHLSSKEELLEVLHNTRIEGDSFSKDELSIAIHALTFGDRKITEVMTPRSVIKYVRAEDILSPVLLGELHQSGFSRFPVIESERGEYVGVLYSKDLSDLKANRTVKDVMRPDLYYVNEFSSLDNVLNVFLRTQHHLFLVVNEFEEVVGIVTIEDIIEQIIGRKIVDEFDQYADLRAVARQLAHKEAASRHGEKIDA
jgi:CBS domain containing-hemolysin-like protein